MTTTYGCVPTWVMFADISAQAVRLYATLHHYVDRATGQTWRARATLAKAMRCSRATLDRALRELVDLGAVTITSRWRSTSGDISTTRDKAHPEQTSSLYTVRFEDPAEVASPVTQPCVTGDSTPASPVQHNPKPDDPKPEKEGRDEPQPKPKRAARPRSVPLSESWIPDIEDCMAQTECDEPTVRFELAQFRDWAKSSGKHSGDWQAELRKFVRGRRPKVVPFQGQASLFPRANTYGETAEQKTARVAAELAAREKRVAEQFARRDENERWRAARAQEPQVSAQKPAGQQPDHDVNDPAAVRAHLIAAGFTFEEGATG